MIKKPCEVSTSKLTSSKLNEFTVIDDSLKTLTSWSMIVFGTSEILTSPCSFLLEETK